MGSNGLTSARHDVFEKSLAKKFPESFDPSVPEDLIYSGKIKLTDNIHIPANGTHPEREVTAGKLVLSPTRTYAPVIKKILDTYRAQLHGMVHCSGGAQTKILHFAGEQLHIIKDNLFPVPPLFELIQKQSKTDWKEMYKVFNMGHRMELYVPASIANAVISISQSFGIPAQVVGRVEGAETRQLTIRSTFGEFNYR
jgi:phosphoribosylformylglycinamidine cyclo-ligase